MMAIRDRQFTYRKSIKCSSDDLELAIIGKKLCTIRVGRAQVGSPQIDLVSGQKKMTVIVGDVDHISYDALTDEHAKLEGFENLFELQADLKKYYGVIDPKQPITIIHFSAATQ